MFNMSDLSIELESTEKAYTSPFEYTFLDSVALNPSDMLPKQFFFFIVGFKFNYFFSINKQITIIIIIMQTQVKFGI